MWVLFWILDNIRFWRFWEPQKNNTENNNFFITENKKLYATPILAALIVAETSD
jgi:hypothetical protein